MGGGYYERDDNNTNDTNYTSYNNTSSSQTSVNFNAKVGMQSVLHPNLDPKNWSDSKISTHSRSPIIFGLDVTGSMGEWVKIIYDKLPMFYGQIMVQKYLEDPAISFCAIGDHEASFAPLQISPFSQGLEIDDQIKKLFLEGGGGGNSKESYELAAWFYLNKCELENSQFPFFFFTGDEVFFEKISQDALKKVIGIDLNIDNNESELSSIEAFKLLCTKFNVFHIRKAYGDQAKEKEMSKKWAEALGPERILDVQTPKACIDVVLGAIAITSGARNLEGYIKDMRSREQTNERIKEVTKSLILYNSRLQTGKITPVMNEFKSKNYVDEFGNEILNEDLDEGQIKNKEETHQLFLKFKESFMNPEEHKESREKFLKIKDLLGNRIPPEFLCPVTGEIFEDPVMTEDGQTYERFAILEWFKSGHSKSPLSGVHLNNQKLIPNISLKKLIDEYRKRNLLD